MQSRRPHVRRRNPDLTLGERNAILGLARGETYAEIAQHITRETGRLTTVHQARAFCRHAYEKIGATNAASAVDKAYKLGILLLGQDVIDTFYRVDTTENKMIKDPDPDSDQVTKEFQHDVQSSEQHSRHSA